jgi:hypothetical protein
MRAIATLTIAERMQGSQVPAATMIAGVLRIGPLRANNSIEHGADVNRR